jgi:hypothetical protein
MGLLEFPNPASWYESVKNGTLERDEVNAFVSMVYSAQISFLWRTGTAKWAQFLGEGKALQDAATAMFLSLRELEKKNFLTLTVPTDMLSADNLARFTTERMTK